MVDSSFVPYASTGDREQHSLFTDIGQRFLRPSLAKSKEISFATTEPEAQEKEQWIIQDKKTFSASDEEQKSYYVVQLFKKRGEQRTANLIRSLTTGYITTHNEFDFQAALIIFPYSHEKAMVYGLGYWETLLNPDCVTPQWGLRLATSGYVCNPNTIKGLYADHYRTSNPFSRREKAADLQPIEAFGVEVGSEELKKVALMPNKSVKTQHVIEGADHVQFTVNPSDKTTPEQTLHSLNTIALHFFTLTTDSNFRIHSRMREFIDEEEADTTLLASLNQRRQELLKSPQAKETFFIHNTLWAKMKSKKLMFGEQESKKHCIFDVFSQLTPQDSFPEIVKVWTPRAKTAKKFDIRWLFYSLPIEYTKDNFYRFDRGHWYHVDNSRFESIKRILRQVKQPSNALSLPSYSIEDTKRSVEQKKADYKEAKYNLRAVQEIKKKAGWEAILLDRINVSLGEAGDKFEFADLLVRHNSVFHIVHVKRAKASQLSHHREQVERSADFLATELTKENARSLFLQGIINGLYEANNLPIKKEKKQGTRITKGNVFLKYYNSLKSQDFLSALSVVQTTNQTLLGFTRQVLQRIDKDFFKNHSLELVSALDALYDCVLHKKAYFTDLEIEEFLNAVKQGIMARQLLFPKGPLKKSDLKNIKIVLAVIDDRAVEATLKGKRQKAQKAIFKNQDLWGLDRTRAMVEKTGLGFTLMVINEVATETDDAFGRIVKKERKESYIDMPGDEPELFVVPHPIKAETSLPFVQAPSYLSQRDLKSLFSAVQVVSTDLNETNVQKLQYVYQNQNYELFTCPTVGDGDCFFHAAFTEPGETIQVVQEKAANMRKQLCDAVQQNQYINELRPLVYEHYLGLLANNNEHQEVPADIKQYIENKNDYTAMYNNMQRFGLSVDTILKPEDRFPIDGILALIIPDQVKAYVEQFRSVGGYETYIPFRPGAQCPVDILASLGQKRINIFTFKEEEKKLQLPKTAGTGTEADINILHTGNHFTRLFCPTESDISFRQCEQIWTNYLLYTGG
ncbi:MAG: TIGR04141 family sporadically distributed protein [Alphaproteobacteria bacterium]|nr:TIGR04141 family sporadically distributed protein [Alphaproteobacteria bacterium]